MVGRPSWRSGTDRETLLEIQKRSGDSLGGLEVVAVHSEGLEQVERHSRRFRTGWKTFLEVRK